MIRWKSKIIFNMTQENKATYNMKWSNYDAYISHMFNLHNKLWENLMQNLLVKTFANYLGLI